MSKDINISVNGVSTDFDDAAKLQTKNPKTGTEGWMPEDETTLGMLTATDNGTYTPGSGLYGFSGAQVDVPQDRITGYMDGTLYVVTVDANGYLVFTEVT